MQLQQYNYKNKITSIQLQQYSYNSSDSQIFLRFLCPKGIQGTNNGEVCSSVCLISEIT
jgi:hypothetical protein